MHNEITVEKLILIPTGTYNDVVHRPLTFNPSHSDLSMMEDVLYSNANVHDNQASFSPTNMSNIASGMMPSPAPTSIVTIAEGWGSVRLKFILIIRQNRIGSSVLHYIQGYSDQYDPSLSGHIDDMTNLYINSVTQANEMVTPQGIKHVVTNSTGVMFDSNIIFGNDIHNPTASTQHAGRPVDVFNAMQSEQLFDGAEVNDSRSMVGVTAVPNSRENGSPAKYLSQVTTGYINALSSDNEENGNWDLLGNAGQLVADNSLIMNPVLRAISGQTGITNGISFTIMDLCLIDENTPHNTTIANRAPPDQINPMAVASNTESWMNTGIETQLATSIGNIVASIAADALITKLKFVASNDGGTNVVQLLECVSMLTTMDMYAETKITNALLVELMPVITINSTIITSINVESNLMGDTYIQISVNGGTVVPYTVPTFADGISSSTIMSSNQLNGLANGVESLLNVSGTVCDNLNAQTSINQFNL